MDDTGIIHDIHDIHDGFNKNRKTEVKKMKDELEREAWMDELHESEKTLDDALLDLNIYENNDSCFPEGYDMSVVQVVLLSRIAHSLEKIAKSMEGGSHET